MNRFWDLPLPQRLLVVGVLMALLGGAVYYLLLMPLSDGISKEARKYKGLMNEYAQLKEFDSAEFRQRIDRERLEAAQRRQEYARMLPREEELPDLITTIKADADAAGLVVTRFDPSQVGQKADPGLGYREIPFRLELVGTYGQILQFLQALAQPSKRLINAKDMNLSVIPPSSASASAGDVGLLRTLNEKERTRGLNPTERYARTVLLFQQQAEASLLKAEMTASAYVYTGAGGAPQAPGGPR